MINADLTRIVEQIRDDYLTKFASTRAINCGECETFADEVVEAYGDDDRVSAVWPMDYCEGNCPTHEYEHDQGLKYTRQCSYDGHCVIQYIGNDNTIYFFDSECPQGTAFRHEIPFFQRQLEFEAKHAHAV